MPAPSHSSADVQPSRAAWVGLAVLTLINMLNYLDRLLVPAVGESIIHSELQLSDTQFGWLASAFLLVYMVTAPFFGALGDRQSRPRLIAGGVAVWSVATALAGLAHSYPALLGARALVGVGEASYSAIAPALLADYFPPRLRGRVYAVFYSATPVGSALGYIVGGLLDRRFGWRGAFFAAGLPGLLLALASLWLVDPPRGQSDGDAGAPATGARLSVWRTYLDFRRNRTFVLTVLGYAAYTFALGGLAVWMPAFLIRVRHVPAPQATVQLGTVLVATGFAGTFLGGWVGDLLLTRTRNAYLWLSGVTALAAAPLGYLALASPTPVVYWTGLVLAELLLFASTSPVNSVIVNAVAPQMRAAAMAACIFLIHVLGDVPSPSIIGFISTVRGLSAALVIVPVAIAISGLIWLYAAYSISPAAHPLPSTAPAR